VLTAKQQHVPQQHFSVLSPVLSIAVPDISVMPSSTHVERLAHGVH
jgi:hypothetical protein